MYSYLCFPHALYAFVILEGSGSELRVAVVKVSLYVCRGVEFVSIVHFFPTAVLWPK